MPPHLKEEENGMQSLLRVKRATKKREHDEFKAEIDALSSHSIYPEAPEIFDPNSKTPIEIAVYGARNTSAVTG